jgi:hypothetical protein
MQKKNQQKIMNTVEKIKSKKGCNSTPMEISAFAAISQAG